MTRLEENRMVIDEINRMVECIKPIGTYEDRMTFQLSILATMLVDISKSLAILADKAESENED